MKSPEQRKSWPWRIGQIVQGVVMGLLLCRALFGLIAFADGVAAFRYQGY